MHSPYKFLWFLLLVAPAFSFAAEHISLSGSTSNSTDGSLNITWTLPENKRIELQQFGQNQTDYKTIYSGSDSATVITGLSDGKYQFRARMLEADESFSDWSEPLVVEVKHHSLIKAFGFFIVGAIVFLGTLLLIVFGNKAKKSGVRS